MEATWPSGFCEAVAAACQVVPSLLSDGDAKTGISSYSWRRKVGVHYPTTWLLPNQMMHAMSEREKSCVLRRKVQQDDACLGGEHNGGKTGRTSEHKLPIVAAFSALMRLVTPFS
jgi:hypothetical protein